MRRKPRGLNARILVFLHPGTGPAGGQVVGNPWKPLETPGNPMETLPETLPETPLEPPETHPETGKAWVFWHSSQPDS